MTQDNDIQQDSSIPSMSDAYYKARKSYGLFCGMLIAWELIGVQLSAQPFKNYDFTVKSPQAAPFVFIALILFFAFRTTIEYHQSDHRRRSSRVSLIDYYVSHSLGLIAIGLYLFQRAADIQFADLITIDKSSTVAIAFSILITIISICMAAYVFFFKRRYHIEKLFVFPSSKWLFLLAMLLPLPILEACLFGNRKLMWVLIALALNVQMFVIRRISLSIKNL